MKHRYLGEGAKQKMNDKVLQAAIRGEESARHGLFTFLLVLTLVNLDIMARKTKKEQERATQTWVAWGVIFVLLAFFFITPEQELIQSMLGKQSQQVR